MPFELTPSEQLAYTTIRIECETQFGTSTGTGFYFDFCQRDGNCVPTIVTNRHVVDGALNGRFHIHLAKDENNSKPRRPRRIVGN